MDSGFGWTGHLPPLAARAWEAGPPALIECATPDFQGHPRGHLVPASRFGQRSPLQIPGSLFWQKSSGEVVGGPAARQAETLTLQAEMASARPLPWAEGGALHILHQPMDGEGRPAAQAPRQVLRRVLSHYGEQGLHAVVGAAIDIEVDGAATDAGPNQGMGFGGLDTLAGLPRAIAAYAEEMGLILDGIEARPMPGEIRLTLAPSEALAQADALYHLRRLVGEAARQTGGRAGPSPRPGAALALSLTLVQTRTGQSLFGPIETAGEGALGRFLGGLQAHLGAAAPLMVPDRAAYGAFGRTGANLTWGKGIDHGLGVRGAGGAPARFETALSHATATPHLAIAGLLAAGYLGLIEDRQPTDPASPAQGLPRDLGRALAAFGDAHKLRMILGEEFARAYGAVKLAEWQHPEPMEAHKA
ncbi:MAG: hypothetical protein AAF871_13330 [Pseudomonadota bacterium]